MRVVGLDIFRGYSILLMVLFHLSFDLDNFHVIDLDLDNDLFWVYFRVVIVALFIFLAGISMKLANRDKILLFKLSRRLAVLLIAASIVSIGSYVEFPDSWIYFGVLHFFLVASILGLPFLKLPKIALVLGLVIIISHYYGLLNVHWLFNLLKDPLNLPVNYTEDLVTIFPWFGLFLLGISFANFDLHYVCFDNRFFNADNMFNKTLSYLGKNSLIIYLIHQPLLFLFFYLNIYL